MKTFLVLNVGLKNKFLPLTIRTLKRRLIKYVVERNHNAYMREYREKKKADETSAKTKHNAYMREYRKKRRLMKVGRENLTKTILVLNVRLHNKVFPGRSLIRILNRNLDRNLNRILARFL